MSGTFPPQGKYLPVTNAAAAAEAVKLTVGDSMGLGTIVIQRWPRRGGCPMPQALYWVPGGVHSNEREDRKRIINHKDKRQLQGSPVSHVIR